jgi:hypothetical protein
MSLEGWACAVPIAVGAALFVAELIVLALTVVRVTRRTWRR